MLQEEAVYLADLERSGRETPSVLKKYNERTRQPRAIAEQVLHRSVRKPWT
jgi:hypothetical protein